MGNSAEKITTEAVSCSKPECKKSEIKPQLKACCACPETKRARDQCIIEKGQENCGSLIEAHKKCMRDMGFNI